MGKSEEFMEKQMIDLSNELEGYEEYMTQNLDGSVCKWEYKPYKGLYKWEGWFLEPKKNNYMVSASAIENKCWEESLIDLATHTPYLKDGILLGVAKIVSNIKRSDNRGFMIDLSDKLEGYENYVTQDLSGEIYKWEYKPIRSNAYSEWQADMGESDSNTWGVSFNKIYSPNWNESLVDLSTHVPWLINGVLTAVPKYMIPNEECYTESTDVVNKPEQEEYTGASVNYYKVLIDDPTSADEPYVAECNDIIEALGMSYAEGNIFKALWRRCAARNLSLKKRGYDSGLYDAEKVVFFGNRLIRMEKKK